MTEQNYFIDYEPANLKIKEFLKDSNLTFRNLVDDVPIYIGKTESRPGISENGEVYQIYIKNE
jgi:hypothetical protein